MHFNDEKTKKDFDAAAKLVFASIPALDKEAHAGQLVLIAPYADPSKGTLYVFGKTFKEVALNARDRFGTKEPVELMSLQTEDGQIPAERAQAMGMMARLQ